MSAERMTKAERDEIAKLVRRREKLAKTDVDRVAAEREAEFEAQLAKRYSAYSEAWRDAFEEAETAVKDLNDRIEREFEEKGVPIEFAPSARMTWMGRGENGLAERRSELRKVAKTRIGAEAKAAKGEIERKSVDVQTQLVAGGLVSEEAKTFLETMPTADALMPSLSVAEIEASVKTRT